MPEPASPSAARPSRRPLEVVKMLVRQWCAERRLRARDGSFRTTDTETVIRTYGAMSERDFEDVNGPQGWLNQHIIPRALRGLESGRPWRIADLGCGSGGSSLILAQHAPVGSTLVGYDACRSLVDRARRRDYRDARGNAVNARFVCQSITEPLQAPGGGRLADASIDVVHSAGVVGHHLSDPGIRALAGELRRVLATDGIAILDAGPRLRPAAVERAMRVQGFAPETRHRLVPARVVMTFRLLDKPARRTSSDGAAGDRLRGLLRPGLGTSQATTPTPTAVD